MSVDLLDDDKILVSYEDGETAVYDAARLRTLEPVETAEGQPGFVRTRGNPFDSSDTSGSDGASGTD